MAAFDGRSHDASPSSMSQADSPSLTVSTATPSLSRYFPPGARKTCRVTSVTGGPASGGQPAAASRDRPASRGMSRPAWSAQGGRPAPSRPRSTRSSRLVTAADRLSVVQSARYSAATRSGNSAESGNGTIGASRQIRRSPLEHRDQAAGGRRSRRRARRTPAAAPAAVRYAVSRRSARDGMEPSEAGVIPALSRNGDAPAARSRAADEPGRLAHADVLSSEEGRFVPVPGPRHRSGRTSSSRPDGG